MIGYVYRIISPSNKQYIGVTTKKDPKARWKEHVRLSHKGIKHRALYYAMNKYGVENMKFEVIKKLPNTTQESLFEAEKYYIKKFDTFKKGYNMTEGGEGTPGLFGELNPFYGHKHTEETKRKLSMAARGHKHTEEWKKKNSELMRKRMTDPNYRKLALESLKASAKARRKKIVCDTDNKAFESVQECSKYYGIDRSSLRQVCNRERATAKGKRFSWYGDNSPYFEDKRTFYQPKKVRCIEKNKTYNSIREASQELNLVEQHISACLHGRQKSTGGLHFEFA